MTPAHLPANYKLARPGNTIVQGIFVGSREMFEAMNACIAENKLKPVVDRVFEFSEAREALKTMESATHFGKIVVKVV